MTIINGFAIMHTETLAVVVAVAAAAGALVRHLTGKV